MRPVVSRFVVLSTFLLPTFVAPLALRGAERPERDVRISYVEGDVRLSRGDGQRIDLDTPWEQPQRDELLESGFALSTGDGRAEIDFDDASSVFLAPNSLLLFSEISASKNDYFTRLTLATGTASFALVPYDRERFVIETPTDRLTINAPDSFGARLTAYLDATSITPISRQGESFIRSGLPTIRFAQGQTFFLQGGDLVEFPGLNLAFFGASNEQRLEFLGSFRPHALDWFPASSGSMVHPGLSAPAPSDSFLDWDSWVAARRFGHAVILTAALQASRLAEPIPGLTTLYERGTFFSCEPYGTCWEAGQPVEAAPVDTSEEPSPAEALYFAPARIQPVAYSASSLPFPATSQTNSQDRSSLPSQASAAFPQTVQWQEFWQDDCGSTRTSTVTRVAHSPQELQEINGRKLSAARRHSGPASFYNPVTCFAGFWIRHHNHYARVITPRPGPPPRCGAKCIPIHPPRPAWVRVAGKIGFVPRHPDDVPGKPPLNLKNGVLLPPAKPGQPPQHLMFSPASQVKVLSHAPAEFQHPTFTRAAALPAPEIRAHLVSESIHPQPHTGHPSSATIAYNYKTREFMAAGKPLKDGAARQVAIGSIHSNGRLASFADGRSHSYASSFFSHSSAASSYNAGRSSVAMNGGYSAGGSGSHFGGGYSGSGSGGSRGGGSSGGSSGGGGGHSSGGGAAASSGGGGGGHTH